MHDTVRRHSERSTGHKDHGEMLLSFGLFHRWEAVEKSRGILISREIEKGLRWDRWRDSYRGLEFRTIRKYVKGIVAAKVSATAKR